MILKKIKIENFKGIVSAEKTFTEGSNMIVADFGTGKTSFLHAYLWAMGYDNIPMIQPIQENMKQIPNLETVVEIEILVDGVSYEIKRKSKQKYKTDKLTQEKTFNGNVSSIYIDNLEMSLKEFKEKLEGILGAKYVDIIMCAGNGFFNIDRGTKWTWKERRAKLFELCNVKQAIDSIIESEKYSLIRESVKKGKSTTEIKKTITQAKRGFKDQRKECETIINLKASELSEYKSIDFGIIKADIDIATEKLETLKSQDGDFNNEEILKLENEILKLENEYKQELVIAEKNQYEKSITKENNIIDINMESNVIDALKDDLQNYVSSIESFKNAIDVISKSEVEIKDTCEFCGQKMPPANLEHAKKIAEEEKQQELKAGKRDIKFCEENIISIKKQIEISEAKLLSLHEREKQLEKEEQESLSKLKEIQAKQNTNEIKIHNIKEKINTLVQEQANEIKAQKNKELKLQLEVELQELNDKYAMRTMVDKLECEIQVSKKQLQELAEQEIQQEKIYVQLEQYIKDTVETVTDTINSNFEGVKFRLFNTFNADADKSIEDTCEVEYDGIPYNNGASAGQRLLADILVNKGLQKLLKIELPLWADDCGVLSNDSKIVDERIKVDGQKIMLITEKNGTALGVTIKDTYK